ncbi:MAG: capsule biosynthesis protein CapC [Synergistales bacterium]|nr:capsule biosynthesis protein CapC [Synergistales bacterium]
MSEGFLWLLAIGVFVGMVIYGRTGISPGGVITPGVLAFSLGAPHRIAGAVLVATAVWGCLELASRLFPIYGRQRIALAMLMALALRIVLGFYMESWSLWLGWAVPGLMAADFQRQGPVVTVALALSGALVSAMAFSLVTSFTGVIP